MKTLEGEKIVRIRPAFGTVRHVLVAGERYYREVRQVVFESDADEVAWQECGPQPKIRFIEVSGPGLEYVYDDDQNRRVAEDRGKRLVREVPQ